MTKPIPAIERFKKKYQINANGCWVWQDSPTAAGYGRLDKGLAHRFAYKHFVGEIPNDLELDHTCRNRMCVNPAHLEPVTHAENLRRQISFHKAKTHCPQGHAYTSENTIIRTNNKRGNRWRYCKTCQRSRKRYLNGLPAARGIKNL